MKASPVGRGRGGERDAVADALKLGDKESEWADALDVGERERELLPLAATDALVLTDIVATALSDGVGAGVAETAVVFTLQLLIET